MRWEMANIVRLPKCGSEWGRNELMAYNIVIRNCEEKEFFGENLDRIPRSVNREFLEFEFTSGKDTPDDNDLLGYLDMASRGQKDQESMVDDFASELLKVLEFRGNGRLIRTRHSIPLLIAGGESKAQTDVCIVKKRNQILLLLQEDKTLESSKDPEPQVIAEAIAAFQENNKIRDYDGRAVLREMSLPCITMVGTSPVFYIVPVTGDLSENVIMGTYPGTKTVVSRFVPVIPRRVSDGMKPIENRKRILQCFELFKKFVNNLERELTK